MDNNWQDRICNADDFAEQKGIHLDWTLIPETYYNVTKISVNDIHRVMLLHFSYRRNSKPVTLNDKFSNDGTL